ncbi:FAD-dependent monooxygenase DEP4 [Lachnellula suecica]|uniref:FAD-dependent monooxygenase DEP4 n=1 Tax=Lachnellula suecica TaxID=602035 RepID=A0A8T9CMA6_9HELO|nr:FAD-dependent monooxygenase DEP4 [Lachnellula suecica]
MPLEKFDVVVVGTGWNGLIAAKTYLELQPNTNLILLDEQASIGGVWSSEKIYPSLFAQIKFGLFEYSFYPMREEGISSDGYISGETIHTYLNDFARDFHLVKKTRLQSKVLKVNRLPGTGWSLDIANKPSIECTKLIYATGATSHPVIPNYPKDEFKVPVIHSSETGVHLDALDKIQRATVVGAAKSAYDTVFFLLNAGKQVDWIIREDGSGPLAIMPPTIFGLVNTMDMVATRMVATLGSSIMSTTGIGYKIFNRTRLGRTLARAFWGTVNTIAERHAGYSKSSNAQKLRPLPHGNGIFWANAGLGAASVPNFWKVFHAGDCTVHRSEIETLTNSNSVTLRNGAIFQTDYIVLCTGFDKSYQPFSEDLQQTCGLAPNSQDPLKWAKLEAKAEETVDELFPALRYSPVLPSSSISRKETIGKQKLSHGPSRHYRRLIVPSLASQGDRSIYFPGFIHTIYTPLVAEAQALWGVAFLLGLHDIPSQPEMEKEAAEWMVWSRKRYLTQGKKHAYAIYDFLSYIDTLVGDLGIDTRRKRNPFAALFLPTSPKDYRGLIDEFQRVQAKKQVYAMQKAKAAAGAV